VDGWGGAAVGPLAAVFVLTAAGLTVAAGRTQLDR
jgi:hypothetical protein